LGELTALPPDSLAGFGGLLLREGKGRGGVGRGGEEKGRAGEGRAGGRKGP